MISSSVPMDPPTSPTTMTVESRGVRFDDECTLIPDPQPRSRMPKLLARPSSFIFKRKLPQDLPSPVSPRDYDAPQSQSPTFPRPALSRKFSLNEGKPPASIQRRSSLPPPSRTHRARAPTLPHTPTVTIPLRPCCPNCFSATERAALQGDSWTENFSRAARKRRSLSADNRPRPPHLLDTDGGSTTTIQWSTVKEGASSSTAVHSVLVVDGHDCEGSGLTDDVAPASASNKEGLSAMRKRFDNLLVQDSEDDGVLPPLLSRNGPWLSPIPSNNPSVDDLSPTCTATEDVDDLPTSCSPTGSSLSPPASPLPETPSSSSFSTPLSSPTISSPPRQRGRPSSSPLSSFRIPKGSTLMRTGSDILKGVSVLGGSGPI